VCVAVAMQELPGPFSSGGERLPPMCPPVGAEGFTMGGGSANAITTTGMFMTYETIATLVVVVFTIGIAFVVAVFRYQERLFGGSFRTTLEPVWAFQQLIEHLQQEQQAAPNGTLR
jgi:hypothetical protein